MQRLILSITKIYLIQSLFYREFWIRFLINGLLPVLIPMWAWISLTNSNSTESSQSYDIQNYYFIVLIISLSSQTELHYEIGRHIYSGSLSQWIVRPLSVAEWLLGTIIARLFTLAVPTLLIVSALIFFSAPHNLLIISFLRISTLAPIAAGILIIIGLQTVLGMLSFWLIRAEGFYAGIFIFFNFLAGSIIPLDKLPSILGEFTKFLPFKYVYYLPAKNALGELSMPVYEVLSYQILIIIFLFIFSAALFKKGLKKYEAMAI